MGNPPNGKTRRGAGRVVVLMVRWAVSPRQGALPKIFSFRAIPASSARMTPVVIR